MPEPRRKLEPVDRLAKVVSICSCCGRIRDEAGNWRVRAGEPGDRTWIEYSHGLCDICSEVLYPQYFAPSR